MKRKQSTKEISAFLKERLANPSKEAAQFVESNDVWGSPLDPSTQNVAQVAAKYKNDMAARQLASQGGLPKGQSIIPDPWSPESDKFFNPAQGAKMEGQQLELSVGVPSAPAQKKGAKALANQYVGATKNALMSKPGMFAIGGMTGLVAMALGQRMFGGRDKQKEVAVATGNVTEADVLAERQRMIQSGGYQQ